MIAEIEQEDGTYRFEERGDPECGKDFCDTCGDCLACYNEWCEDGCRWVIYLRRPRPESVITYSGTLGDTVRAVMMEISAERLRKVMGLPESVTITHVEDLGDGTLNKFVIRIEGDEFPEVREGFSLPRARALFNDNSFVLWELH